ncbi:MAG: adenylate kinase, partial [Lachnospiraceae bacterium]|nr:adenylate kinase [Lachnospiraceae bacterium]
DDEYLLSIRFICLALSDAYIDAHFDDIRNHASDIESRGDDSYLRIDMMKETNRAYIEGFKESGEMITLIEDDYEKVISDLLKDKR